MKTATMVGSGPSCDIFDWDRSEGDLCAVSSGIIFVPEMPVHFFSCDNPHFFAKTLCGDEDVQKHVPHYATRWMKHPNVLFWDYDHFLVTPTFGRSGDIAQGPPVNGVGMHNTLLFAVQVVARLGYEQVRFIGCDLYGDAQRHVVEAMRAWAPLANAAGIEWLNLSPLSALQEFMPDAPAHERAMT